MNAAPRQEEEQARGQPAGSGQRRPPEVRQFSLRGTAEHAPPHAAGADEDDVHLRAADEQLMDDAGRTDDLAVAALQPAGRINQKALSGVEPRGDGVDEVLRLGGRRAALGGEVGHLEGADELHQGQQRQQAVGARIDERPQRRRQRHVGQYRRRIDVGRVVGEHECRAAEPPHRLHAVGGDAIAEVQQRPHESPEESIGSQCHGGVPNVGRGSAGFSPPAPPTDRPTPARMAKATAASGCHGRLTSRRGPVASRPSVGGGRRAGRPR
jgi:hypothetical protein